jgi:hypothetical protein
MNHRRLFLLIALATALAARPSTSAAQEVTAATVPGTPDTFQGLLAFSTDGRFLREIGTVSTDGTQLKGHVRAVTYVAATGAVRRVWNLPADTWTYSTTTDESIAVVSADRDREGARAHLLLLSVETGRTQDIPAKWFDADEKSPYAQISGDGKFVSAYSDSNDDMQVSVYRWRTRKLVAKQTSGFFAGGFMGGGVTADGKIEFSNNRSGSHVVDPKTGRALVSYGPHAVRSADGRWIVEYPNPSYGDDGTNAHIRDGISGQTIANVDLQMTDDELNTWWTDAFCGTTGRFVASGADRVFVFEIPSGKKIAAIRLDTWKDPKVTEKDVASVACSPNGKRIAIRSRSRLTIHDLN